MKKMYRVNIGKNDFTVANDEDQAVNFCLDHYGYDTREQIYFDFDCDKLRVFELQPNAILIIELEDGVTKSQPVSTWLEELEVGSYFSSDI